MIKQKRGATVVVVKDWVKRYKQDHGKAASELVNLVVSVGYSSFPRNWINSYSSSYSQVEVQAKWSYLLRKLMRRLSKTF